MADLIEREPLLETLKPDENATGKIPSLYETMKQFAREKIKKAPAVNRWIPCSERMPEENEYVLAFVKRKHSISRVVLSVLIEGEWKIGVNECSSGFNVVGVVTHWMPLPEPPEKE